jgi:proteasome assembly chaperone (PAC2) family protein
VADELRIDALPSLERPVLVAAFRGWNDGGQGATLAGAYLAKLWDAQRFADVDPEGFYDFQAVRPSVTLEEGDMRKIDWPENTFYFARGEGLGRDVVLLLGIEPSHRWRTFSELVIGLSRELGVEMMITLGALLADVPHTRPSPVTGAATDPALVEELGLAHSRYEGPTGIVGVLHDACHRSGIPSASLWAAVPHYVQLTPSPRAAKALCERLATILGGTIDTTELDEASDAYAQQVSEAVATDEETLGYVEELERRVDAIGHEADIPSGDAIAAELTRFLREQDDKRDDEDDVAREQ